VGFGGSCFPKDVDALANTAQEHGMDLKILAATNGVNKAQKQILAQHILGRMGPDLKGTQIAVWGLAFKPNTDDMREAASIDIIDILLEAGAKVTAYDPEAMHTARRVFGDRITYAIRPYDALKGADALALITEWSEFRKPDWDRVKRAMSGRLIFDGRNIFEPGNVEALGFEYYGIGRGRNVNRRLAVDNTASNSG